MPSAPYSNLRSDWRDNLARIIKQQRYTKRSIALKAGLGETTVSEWLNPKKRKQPNFTSMVKVAEALGISVDSFFNEETGENTASVNGIEPVTVANAHLIGVVEAGAWREFIMYAVEDDASIPLVPNVKFQGIKQFAWKVIGQGANKVAKAGSYVIGVSFSDISNHHKIQSGDLVVCQIKDGKKYEHTLKRVVVVDGRFRLDAETDDKRLQQAVWLSVDDREEDRAVRATHLIIGGFTSFI